MKAKTLELLTVPKTAPSRRVRLTAFKRARGILTHRAGFLSRREERWLALLPFECDRRKRIGRIMAESCRLYDEAGWLATATGELTAVRAMCNKLGIHCGL